MEYGINKVYNLPFIQFDSEPVQFFMDMRFFERDLSWRKFYCTEIIKDSTYLTLIAQGYGVLNNNKYGIPYDDKSYGSGSIYVKVNQFPDEFIKLAKEFYGVKEPEKFNAQIINSRGKVIFPFHGISKEDAGVLQRLVDKDRENGGDCILKVEEIK